MLVTLFVILLIIAAVVLGFFVLIQNPKGGGLAGTFGGVSSQFMGVKQTNDILEKGTWIFAAIIGLLSLFATFLLVDQNPLMTEDYRTSARSRYNRHCHNRNKVLLQRPLTTVRKRSPAHKRLLHKQRRFPLQHNRVPPKRNR